MSFGTFCFVATALLVQTVYGQQCGYPSYGGQVVSPISMGSLNYGPGIGSGCGGNLGFSGANIINSGSSNQAELLAISAGSLYGPGGIVVNSDNLEIGGQLIVSGQFPVIGTVVVSGELPTGGQAQVQYNSGSGVGLTTGGCGYGLPSSQPNVGYGGSGMVGNPLGYGCL